MVELSSLEYLQGILTFLAVIISIILGLIIIAKYFRFKQKNLLLVGLAWIFTFSAYWSDSTTFLMIILLGEQLDWPIYFFLCNAFLPLGLVLWATGMANLTIKNKQKELKIIILIIAIIYETIFMTILVMNADEIGTPRGPFTVEWALFIDLFLLSSILFFLVTGFLFVRTSLLSENRDIKLKGKFLLIAFISFTVGTFTDVVFEATEVSIALARIFLIIASFFFYVGFTLPKWLRKLVLQDSE